MMNKYETVRKQLMNNSWGRDKTITATKVSMKKSQTSKQTIHTIGQASHVD
jgi:hypothetical protein